MSINLNFDFERDVVPLLPRVAKPARYTGGEYNSVVKAESGLDFVLCYPDVYEIGMSNLGLRILYQALNEVEGIAAERAYVPWPDLEVLLRDKEIPLWTLERHRPLAAADLVGITLQYEMTFTNILLLLELSRIPLLAADRRDGDPVIVGGGPCAFNPAPLAPWFDIFVLGDGDRSVVEVAQTVRAGKEAGQSRAEIVAALCRLPYVWAPELKREARRSIVGDLADAPFPVRQLVPNVRAIQDRGLIEVSRGCTNGCRFCHAGMTYRPVRERTPDELVALATGVVDATGFDEISLASLSISDYTRLEELIRRLNGELGPRGVSFSLPSLHVDSFTLGTAALIGELRKSGLTFAIEAGDPVLRQRINKPVDDEHLMGIFRTIFAAGWKQVKLYFMIGFPGETGEAGKIADFVERAHRAAPKLAIHLNVGIFIPKPHTPLQWGRQMSIAEGWESIRALKDRFRKGIIRISYHQPEMSFLEGVFARGGADAARLLGEAYRRGARLDAWDEHFRFGIWQEAMDALGFAEERFLAPFSGTADALPWDGISGVAGKAFLVREYGRYAGGGTLTADCRPGCVEHCGVCRPGEGPKMAGTPAAKVEESAIVAVAEEEVPAVTADPSRHPGGGTENRHVYRIEFSKTGLLRFVSHLDMQSHLLRALTRSGLPLSMSEGFNPKPRLSLVAPSMLGMACRNDILEIELTAVLDDAEVLARLQAVLPAGLAASRVRRLDKLHSGLVARIVAHRYRATLPLATGDDGAAGIVYRIGSGQKLKEFLQAVWGCPLEDLLAAGLERDALFVEDDGVLGDAFDA